MSRKSRNKGKRGELEAAKELVRLFNCEAERGQQRSGSPDSPDVRCSIDGLHVEVKRTERLRIYDAIEQARSDCGDKLPLVLHRQNNRPWLAVVALDDLPNLSVLLYLTLAANQ